MAKKSKKQKSKKIVDQSVVPAKEIPVEPIKGVSFWSKNLLPGILLFLLAMGIYGSTASFEYVLDDSLVFTKHKDVKKGFAGIPDLLTKESFAGYFGEQKNLVVGARYRPLSLITFAMEFEFTQRPGVDDEGRSVILPNPRVSHIINILLYGLAALLLFRVMGQWFPIKNESKRYWNLAFIGTLLFVLHPIHTEVVANVKGRDEIMVLIGALSVCYFSWKYFEKGNLAWMAAAAGAMMLALLAKENALTFIAIVPLAGYFFRKTPKDRLLIATLTLFVVGLGYLKLRSDIIGYFLSAGNEIVDLMNNPFYGLDTGKKFATIFYTLGLYLKLLIFPHPLTHDYYPFHIPVMNFGDWRVILSLLINIALGFLALYGLFRKKDPLSKGYNHANAWAFGILFYFITFSIVSNIPFTVGTFMNERFVFISSLGFCILLAWLIVHWLPEKIKGAGTFIGYGLLGIFCLGFLVKTITRIPDWATPLSLNTAAIKTSPNSARANTFYGTAIFNQYKVTTDRNKKYELLDEVEHHIDRALEINPVYYSAMLMKAGVIAEQHKRTGDTQKLLDDFYKVITIKPNVQFVDTYLDYIIDREAPGPIVNWAIKAGNYWTNKNQFGIALRYYNLGLKANANDPNLRQAVSVMYQRAGNPGKAAEYGG